MRVLLFLFLIFSFFFLTPLKAMTLGAQFDVKTKSNIVHKIAIIGKDDRTDIPPLYSDTAAAIGLLYVKGKKSKACTAFCVASNIIGTNAHCLFSKSRKNKIDLGKTVFFLPSSPAHSLSVGYESQASGLHYADPEQPKMSIYSGDYSRLRSFKNQNYDWAFAKLKSPICKGRFLKFGYSFGKDISLASKNNKIFMIGFHGDKKLSKRYYSECKLRSVFNKRYKFNGQVLLYPGSKMEVNLGYGKTRIAKPEPALIPHTCDSYKGSSGSPLLIKLPEGRVNVIGINIGQYKHQSYRIYKDRYTGKVVKRTRISNGPTINMSVNTRPFMYGLIFRFGNEKLIDKLEEFRTIQFYLKFLKFYKGKVDGVYGKNSRNAIKRYELSRNLIQTGVPTKRLLELLKIDAKNTN